MNDLFTVQFAALPLCPFMTWEIHPSQGIVQFFLVCRPPATQHWAVNMHRWVSICVLEWYSAFLLATKDMLLLWFFSHLLWRYCVIHLMPIHSTQTSPCDVLSLSFCWVLFSIFVAVLISLLYMFFYLNHFNMFLLIVGTHKWRCF